MLSAPPPPQKKKNEVNNCVLVFCVHLICQGQNMLFRDLLSTPQAIKVEA